MDEIDKLSRFYESNRANAPPDGQISTPVRRRRLGFDRCQKVAFEEPGQVQVFRPPSAVIGQPVDESCLAGVLKQYQYSSSGNRIYSVRNAQVVGWRSIIDQNGLLYTPRPQRDLSELRVFIERSRPQYEGFLIVDPEANPVAVFASKPEVFRFDGAALFIPFIEQGNYGSFLSRGLPGLLFAAGHGITPEWIIVPERTPWVMESIRIAGFRGVPVLSVREVCGDLFSEILIVDVPDNEGLFDPSTLARLRTFQMQVDPHPVSAGKWIYASRRLSNLSRPTYRVLVNEHDVERQLVARGFSVVFPETMSFSGQVRMFEQAERIVGPSGSGMLNCIFSPEGSKIVDLEFYMTTVRQHAKLYSSTGKSYQFVFGKPLSGDGPLAFRNWDISWENVAQAL